MGGRGERCSLVLQGYLYQARQFLGTGVRIQRSEFRTQLLHWLMNSVPPIVPAYFDTRDRSGPSIEPSMMDLY